MFAPNQQDEHHLAVIEAEPQREKDKLEVISHVYYSRHSP